MPELELPPTNRTGWPWTEANTDTAGLEGDLPRITVITPSFNQAQFIEETIRSVLNQNYGNLQYIVMDGGSADESAEIIQKYAPFLDYWVSQRDSGQSNAINSGVSRANGELVAWLNSDDVFLPGALHAVAKAYREHPGSVVAGGVLISTDDESTRGENHPRSLDAPHLLRYWTNDSEWSQPGLFFPTAAWREVGGLDESLHFVMDFDLLCRVCAKAPPVYIKRLIARYRLHEDCKCVNAGIFQIDEDKTLTKAQVSSFLRYNVERDIVMNRYATHTTGTTIKEYRQFMAGEYAFLAGRALRQRRIGFGMQALGTAAARGMLPATVASLIQQSLEWFTHHRPGKNKD